MLRLKAADDDDLEVFAAVLQDAPMPLAEVAFLERERRFAALLRRFCYERERGGKAAGDGLMQVECALMFDHVAAASTWELGGLGGAGEAALLTVVSEDKPAGGVSIALVFHGGGLIRLEAERVAGRLADIGQPRPAEERPRHRPPV